MPRLNPSGNAQTRFDETTGAIRSSFNPDFLDGEPSVLLSITDISDEFLHSNKDLFALEGIDLFLMDAKEGSTQITCRYGQRYANIPVYGASLNVTIRKADRQVVSTVNKIDYQLGTHHPDPVPLVATEEAIDYVNGKYGRIFQGIILSEPRLFIYKGTLVWQVDMDTDHPKVNLELLIDALECGFVAVFDRRRYYSSRPGKVFWPDPVTSARNPTLSWDSPTSLLDAELVPVTLENLNEPVKGKYRLKGKWVTIRERESPRIQLPVTETVFAYSTSDRKFLSVMAYYFLDRLIEWIHSLDIPALNQALIKPVDVDAQGLAMEDNSHFVVPVSGNPYIAFGEGGTPDASDPGVITHEFGHALHYHLLGRSVAAGPFEEGFNDFLSCVFRDRYNIHGFDRANPFPWDNNSTVCWDAGRRCDSNLRFDDPGFRKFGFYQKGTVYASALWDIYLEMGGNSVDSEARLKAAQDIIVTCLDMLIAVGDTEPIEDLANGLISSDISRSGGENGEVIRAAFAKKGLWS